MQYSLNQVNSFNLPKTLSYRAVCRIIISRWYWLLGIIAAGLLAGTLYLEYQQKLYVASGSIRIDDKRSELTELINVRNFYDRTNKTESERFILRSRNVLRKALSSLNTSISFFKRDQLALIDLYPLRPLDIKLVSNYRDEGLQRNEDFEFEPLYGKIFRLTWDDEEKRISKQFRYGDTVCVSGFKFSILKQSSDLKNKKCTFRINSQEQLLKKAAAELSIDDTQNTNIISLRITDANPFFARDMLNAVLTQYQKFDRLQRTASTVQTKEFITSLLSTMSAAVKSSGQAIQEFKINQGLLSVPSALNTAAARLTERESQRHQLNIQSIMISDFKEHLQKSEKKGDLSYSPQDIADPRLNTLISSYNELIIEKKKLLGFYTSSAPAITRIDSEIGAFTQAIYENISAKLKNNTAARRVLSSQIDSINASIISLPKAERTLVSLQSRFDIDQKVFNYLSEKQLEAQIAGAAATSAAVIIDRAVLPSKAAFPVPVQVYTSSVLIGIFVGTAFIFLKRILDPCIYTRQEIEAYTAIPIVGVIRKYYSRKNQAKIPLLNEPRSIFAESVRSVRGSLNFLASEKTNKIICISSEISGEGKSFVSLNIAVSLTLLDKKVLLLATDMRKSNLHSSFNLNNDLGLSQYLSNQKDLGHIIRPAVMPNLDFITSGPVPPNPSELIQGNKMSGLLNKLRPLYDFIIIDSAPIGLVTDGKPLIEAADINLFILRSGVSKRQFAFSPERLSKEFGLSNFSIILNDYQEDRFRTDFYGHDQTARSFHYPDQAYNGYNKEYFRT